MQSEIAVNSEVVPIQTYPVLKKRNDVVVMFLKENYGVVVVGNTSWSLGEVASSFDESSFEIFTGKVIMGN